MLVGGLGGIGRAVARWMIDNGARNLIFVNRSGLSRQEARDSVEAHENQGAKVSVSACDVSDSEQLSQVVSESSSEMPPIRGVIHTAMVLRVSHPSVRGKTRRLTDFIGYPFHQNDSGGFPRCFAAKVSRRMEPA